MPTPPYHAFLSYETLSNLKPSGKNSKLGLTSCRIRNLAIGQNRGLLLV